MLIHHGAPGRREMESSSGHSLLTSINGKNMGFIEKAVRGGNGK